MTRILEQLSGSRFQIHLLVVTALQIVALLKKLTPADVLFQKIVESLESCAIKIQQYYDYQKASKYTDIIGKADEERDGIFKSLTEMVSSIMHRKSKPEESDAATQVYGVIENYGVTLYREGYTKETFLMNGLLEELKKAPMVAAIEKIKVTDLVEELRTSEKQFEQLFNDKHEDEDNEDIPQIKTLKKDILYNLNALVTLIDISAFYKIETFLPVIPQLNGIIMESMKAFRATQTRKETSAEEDEENNKKDNDKNEEKKGEKQESELNSEKK